ncbi:hypothetical protein HHK36_028375 [Tetracentron sinense]|uniref:Uncharacterized protein n=1 Tax=Tetracentron sinense TaxID=13715 RepID=A0A834YEX3_TETSI|nr:hypothetical protein HHK36_028375 [Tetracentron sinense]
MAQGAQTPSVLPVWQREVLNARNPPRVSLVHHDSSTFELLTAFLWRCRTIALQLDPHQKVRVLCIFNARAKSLLLPLPAGYHGNAFAFPAAVATAEKLCKNPLEYALELVKKTKANREYLMAIKGRPVFQLEDAYIVSDLTRLGFREVEFGWGNAVYGGPAAAIPDIISFLTPFKNGKGEDGIVVPVCLPWPAMERFRVEQERNDSSAYLKQLSRLSAS